MALGNQFNIDIKQGATFQLTITWKDSAGTAINLTNYTARAQARLTYDTAATIFSLTSSSGITLGGAAGTIAIVIAAASKPMSSETNNTGLRLLGSGTTTSSGARPRTAVVICGAVKSSECKATLPSQSCASS